MHDKKQLKEYKDNLVNALIIEINLENWRAAIDTIISLILVTSKIELLNKMEEK